MPQQPKIAYFSMEVGLFLEPISSNGIFLPTRSSTPISGGLGVLAGDAFQSAADLGYPLVGVTMLPNKGYFRQIIAEGRQQEEPDHFDPSKYDGFVKLPQTVTVNIQGKKVSVGAWKYDVVGRKGTVPVYFLDTNGVDGNNNGEADITDKLYQGDVRHRIKQEAVLGIGGIRMLKALGYDLETDVGTYHMNEGHAAFLTLELLRQLGSAEEVIKKVVFTTHTPVPAGHDKFEYDVAGEILGDVLPSNIRDYAGHDGLNMTSLALKLSRYVNAVSQRHAQVASKELGREIDYITNGVHSETWTSPEMKAVFDELVPGWREDPSTLQGIQSLNAYYVKLKLRAAHQAAKARLIKYIQETSGVKFNPELLTIGFARRAAEYKRAALMFHDIEELKKIGRGKIQLVFAGKAHPKDDDGKGLVEAVNHGIEELNGNITAVYLPNHSMYTGALLTQGVDLWLNTPRRPNEASGTSGMKAAHNGVPSLSILDGWWPEGYIEGITGWSIGSNSGVDEDARDAGDLYRTLDKIVIPTFFNGDWGIPMLYSIAFNASRFNTHRMVKEYAKEAWGLGKIPLDEIVLLGAN